MTKKETDRLYYLYKNQTRLQPEEKLELEKLQKMQQDEEKKPVPAAPTPTKPPIPQA